MKTTTSIAATILLVAATATPGLAMPHQGADMLRSSLTQSLRSIGVDGRDLDDLTLSQVAQLRGILDSGDSDGVKAFRAQTLIERAER